MIRVAQLAQHVPGELEEVGGHAVGGGDRAQGQHVLIGAGVAHDADRLDRQQHGEGLPDLVVEAGLADFVQVDGVGLLQVATFSGVISPGMRMARPGPGNGWRPTKASGRPSSTPRARTSSLNSSRRGSTSFSFI
jgi:hypothetical protein